MKNLLHVVAGILIGFPFMLGVLEITMRLLPAKPLFALTFVISLSASIIFYMIILKVHKPT